MRGEPELADIPVVIVTIVDEQRRGIALGRRGVSDEADRPRAARRGAVTLSDGASAEHVLVVEDDEEQRRLCGEMLSSRGWTVREAANGREALDL